MKKVCIIYANCQNKLLAELLAKSPAFTAEYTVHAFSVHLLLRGKTTLDADLLSQAKLFIYQPVKDIHGVCSTNYILDRLPADCQRLSFPPLYFTGYFPQFCKNPANKVVKQLHPYGIIPQGDRHIISLLDQSSSVEEIADRLADPNFYQRSELLENVENNLNELARRESSLDIKVSDFIRDNYQKYRLFYTHNHPTDKLGIYVVDRILAAIGLPPLAIAAPLPNPQTGILDNVQVPLYPSVIEHLELEFASQIAFYQHKSFCTNKLTFRSYIAKYVDVHLDTADSATSHYVRGIEQIQQKQLALAEQSLHQAIAIDGSNAAYYRALATVYQQQEQLDRAEAAYKQAIEISPDWVEFYQSLADILTAKEDLMGAALLYKQAIKLEPENEEFYSLLGDTLVKLERLDLAEKCYLRAVRLNPDKAHNYRCLGDIYRQNKSLDKAVSAYEAAIAAAPTNPWLYVYLSEALIEQNKIEEAKQNCKQSLNFKRSQRVGFYRRVGNLQVKIGSFDEAISTYRQAIKLNPSMPKQTVRQIRSQIQHATQARDCNTASS